MEALDNNFIVGIIDPTSKLLAHGVFLQICNRIYSYQTALHLYLHLSTLSSLNYLFVKSWRPIMRKHLAQMQFRKPIFAFRTIFRLASPFISHQSLIYCTDWTMPAQSPHYVYFPWTLLPPFNVPWILEKSFELSQSAHLKLLSSISAPIHPYRFWYNNIPFRYEGKALYPSLTLKRKPYVPLNDVVSIS